MSVQLHALNEDGMKVLILSASHVITNYTRYDLNYSSFAIQTNEKSTELNFQEALQTGGLVVKCAKDTR